MTGGPTLAVHLDDGTGTYPTNVTTRVRLPDALAVSGYGRGDEFDQPQAAQVTLVLDNADGAFTSGGTYDVSPGTGVRVTMTKSATTVDRFTGRISGSALGWPGGGQEFATVTVTVTDVLGDLARRPMRSMLEEEILLLDPTAYYTLGEAEGSTSAGDSSGNGNPSLRQTGSGAKVVFGNGTGPVDGLTAATFAGGKFLTNAVSPGASFSDLICFSKSSAPANQEILFIAARELLVLETNGKLSLYDAPPGGVATPQLQSSVSLCDGDVHQVGFSVESGIGYQLFVDGVTSSVAFAAAGTLVYLIDGMAVGGSGSLGTVASNVTGNVSHVAHFDGTVLTAMQVTSVWDVASGTEESTDARLTRLAGYAGIAPTTVNPSGQLMPVQATSGQSLFDALQTVAEAEGGVVFADGSGGLVMQGRDYRGLRTTADVTVSSDLIDPGTAVTWDTQQKINQVTATATDGAAQVVSAADVLADRNTPIYPASLDLAVATDDDALAAAQWTLAKHTDTTPRLGSVTFDLMTASNVDAEALLGLAIGDRLALTPMPSQMWAAGDYSVEGWTETLTDTAWTLTANLLPWSLAQVFILNDATYGLLDSTTPLGY